jgi:hypothetical protein
MPVSQPAVYRMLLPPQETLLCSHDGRILCSPPLTARLGTTLFTRTGNHHCSTSKMWTEPQGRRDPPRLWFPLSPIRNPAVSGQIRESGSN